MRTIIFIGVISLMLVVVTVKADVNADINAAFKECIKEIGVPAATMEQFYNNKLNVANITKEMKCHLKCEFEKLKLLKKDGPLDEAQMVKFLQELNKSQGTNIDANNSLKKCESAKVANNCDSIFTFAGCLVKEGYFA